MQRLRALVVFVERRHHNADGGYPKQWWERGHRAMGNGQVRRPREAAGEPTGPAGQASGRRPPEEHGGVHADAGEAEVLRPAEAGRTLVGAIN
uniref:Uncharacterized protein n=1 Tax=Oryza brachyantha TaxID=4533 RepID=J3L0N0_ORYBR